jgi:uncharacterized Zn-binding protein involved in type VI secretion
MGDAHVCPMATPVPHIGGPIVNASPTVLITDLPAARMGDDAVCTPAPSVVVMGSATVLINSRGAARMGDSTAHGGVICVGAPTVLIGG